VSDDILRTREDVFSAIADWLRSLNEGERSALAEASIDDGADLRGDPTLRGISRMLAPALMRLELGGDPSEALLESPRGAERVEIPWNALHAALAELLAWATSGGPLPRRHRKPGGSDASRG
jgi:hypothetical protein